MVEFLVAVGLAVAVFVGFNIGGSSTGVAFGPGVGSRIVRKGTAAALFTLFALLGAWTVGRNVIDTMSSEIVAAAAFSPEASVGVLFFTGTALLISNLYGVPASTSMTAVGSIVGLGLATGTLNSALMFTVLSAWIISPLISLFAGALFGRYLYPHLNAKLAFGRLQSPLVKVDQGKLLPRLKINKNAASRDLIGSTLVITIACYMGFSAGASNAANAVAPLVGNGALDASPAILLAVGAMSLGAFTIARRTLDTVGSDITDMPILASLIVSTVGATIITLLSWLGIPASLAVSTTSCIIGLGWGRLSRARTLVEIITPTTEGTSAPAASASGIAAADADSDTETPVNPTVGELAEGEIPDPEEQQAPEDAIPAIGEETPMAAGSLFDSAATARIVVLWVLTPSMAVAGSYLLFSFLI